MTRLGAASVPAVATALTLIGASILTSTTEVATIVGDAVCGDVCSRKAAEKGTKRMILRPAGTHTNAPRRRHSLFGCVSLFACICAALFTINGFYLLSDSQSSVSSCQPAGAVGTVWDLSAKTKARNAFGALSLVHSRTFAGSSMVPNIGFILRGRPTPSKYRRK